MEKEVLLTQEGYNELAQRLDYLKLVKRPEITERIKEAKSHGDLSENAEYDAAKTEQGIIEGEIKDIDMKLKLAKIIQTDGLSTGIVSIGNKVKVLNSALGGEITYEIVGTTEADIAKNKISNISPAGIALLGKKVGSKVTVKGPTKSITLTIKEII